MAMGRIIPEEETERQGYAAISFFSAVVGKGLFRMVALPFGLRGFERFRKGFGFGGQIRIGFQLVLLRADKERFVAAQVGEFGDVEQIRAKRDCCAEQKQRRCGSHEYRMHVSVSRVFSPAVRLVRSAPGTRHPQNEKSILQKTEKEYLTLNSIFRGMDKTTVRQKEKRDRCG